MPVPVTLYLSHHIYKIACVKQDWAQTLRSLFSIQGYAVEHRTNDCNSCCTVKIFPSVAWILFLPIYILVEKIKKNTQQPGAELRQAHEQLGLLETRVIFH